MRVVYSLFLSAILAMITAEALDVNPKKGTYMPESLSPPRQEDSSSVREHMTNIIKHYDKSKNNQLGALVKLTDYPDAVCLDGTPGAYYYFPGKHKDKWIFLMEGGGLCTSTEDCASEWGTLFGSSKDYLPVMVGAPDGFSDRDCTANPEFCDYQLVYVQYCDAGLYSGALDDPIVYQNKSIYHRGDSIRKAVMQSALEFMLFYATKEVIVSGCSAGAYATFLHSDQMLNWAQTNVPTVTKVGAVPMSGFFLLAENMAAQPVMKNMINHMFNVINASVTLNPDCIADQGPDNAWRCAFAQYAYNYSKVPTFVFNSKSDAWQLICILLAKSSQGGKSESCMAFSNYTQGVCPALTPKDGFYFPFGNCTDDQMGPIIDYQDLFVDLLTTNNGFKRAANGAFIISCFTHCAAALPNFWHGFYIGSTLMSASVSLWWMGLDAPRADGKGPMDLVEFGSQPNVYMDCQRSLANNATGFECNLLCAHTLGLTDAETQQTAKLPARIKKF